MATRRGNNEGSIYQRKNGKWQAQVSIDGRRIGKTLKTKLECQEWVRLLERQKVKGLSFSAASATAKDYLEEWLVHIKPNLRDKSWRQYRGILQNHVIPKIGAIKMIDLASWQIQSFYSWQLSQGVGERTVQLTHTVLHKAFQDAKQHGMLSTNPFTLVSRPRVEKKEMKFLTDVEVKHLLIAVQGNRNEALYQLAVTTGMRQGELLGQKWSDIDWASSTTHVKRQLVRITGKGLVLTQPKTRRSIRTVQLGPDTLRKLMELRNSHEVEFGRPASHEDFVFQTRIQTPIDPRRLWGEFKDILGTAGLRDIRFHDLRHTAASLMLSSGMAVIRVSQQLGHSKPSTTLDSYGHLIPGFDKGAGARIDQLVNPIATQLQLAEEFSDVALVNDSDIRKIYP